MVVPSVELKQGQSSMILGRAIKRWPLVQLAELKAAVHRMLAELQVKQAAIG
jgi:hypothetical protein